MTDKLDAWKKKSFHDVTLPSGTKVTIRLPSLKDCIAAGEIPMPVLNKLQRMAKSKDAQEDMTEEELQHASRFQDEIVKATLRKVEGELVTLGDEDLQGLPEEDKEELYLLGVRETPVPKAAG